jgi:Invasion associated locus B (IalB) protein
MRSISRKVAAGLLGGLVAGLLVVPASGQTRVDAKRDWSIFEAGEGGSKVCWIVSQPKTTSAARDGQTVQVNRGDIFLMVAIRPGDNVKNEVSYLGGYPFKEGSNVTLTVGSNNYTLFTNGENAWTQSATEDDQITAAFRSGSDARVVGESSRGTTTRDIFSLSGFTAALDAARQRCS